jgi:hypothetical protein
MADYRIGEGKDRREYTVPGLSLAECPVSFITQRSRNLLSLWERQFALKPYGVSLFGPIMMDWPHWAVDLIQTLEVERAKVEAALMKRPPRRRTRDDARDPDSDQG